MMTVLIVIMVIIVIPIVYSSNCRNAIESGNKVILLVMMLASTCGLPSLAVLVWCHAEIPGLPLFAICEGM